MRDARKGSWEEEEELSKRERRRDWMSERRPERTRRRTARSNAKREEGDGLEGREDRMARALSGSNSRRRRDLAAETEMMETVGGD